LEAAQKAGVRIPTLCHDKRLLPYGSCRLCVVEVTARGRTRTMPACFNPARDGMEVATSTPRLIESRRMQLMLLLRSHPLLCPSCDAAGKCVLQDLVHEYEIPELPFAREARYFHVDNDSHFIRFNMNLCIRCGMCTRICDEVQGENELSYINRGYLSEISTDFGRPLNCEFCGQCAQVCPVGAICSKWLVGTGRYFELTPTNTVCSFCSLGCVLTLGHRDRKVVYVDSPEDSPNQGSLCVKGRYGWPYVYSSERITKPLIRRGDRLQEVEWNEALAFVAEGFERVKHASGPSSLAALGSERLTNEDAYVFNRFVRTVLETPNLDHSGGYGYRALVDGLGAVLGYPASTNPIRDLRHAKVILLVGADLTETHPVAKNEIILATDRHRAKVIVVDSIRTKISDRRESTLAAVPPGSEHLILNAMLKFIIDHELYEKTALNLRAEGLNELLESLADYTVDNVAAATGVDPALITEPAKEYAQASAAAIVMTAGMNRTGFNVETARAAANLAVVTGHIGRPGSGVFVFAEKANAQGAVDMGLGPDLLPGFHRIDDDAARTKFEAAWSAPIPADKGLSAREIMAGAQSGQVRALYVVGENPLETYPDRANTERALRNLEFLVVQDLFLTSTAGMADAVLPVASFAEKIGTFTSAERRIQAIRPCAKISGCKTDLEIFTALAALMGRPSMTYAGPKDVMDEIAGVVDAYKGVSYERLGQFGVPWPCVDPADPGKDLLYEDGFPGSKAKLLPAPPMSRPEEEGLPMYLIPCLSKFHSGSFSQWSPSMVEVSPEGLAEMHSKDLKALGLKEGDTAKITGADGVSVELGVKRSRRALEGSIVVPYHFPGLKLNYFTRWDHSVVKVKVEKA